MQIAALCCLFLVHVIRANNQDNTKIRIRISDGEVEGILIKSDNGATGHGFMGIPYAEPPLGPLRFRNPIPPAPWDGVLQCKQYKSNCWQIHTTLAGEKFTGIEDCLYLNVFSGLDCSQDEPCPVLFYIHGGGFEFDTPNVFPPELLVENFASRGLTVVTVAYRLNAFGFWSTGGDEAMGNYGIYDMIAGLKWVQREIHNFGGNPNKVTIMGHSIGGISVSLLSISPKARSLFHQGVMMSGNAFDDHALQNDLSLYRHLASALGCANKTGEPWREWVDDQQKRDVVECMRNVDADRLGKTYLEIKGPNDRTAPRNDGPDGLFPLPVSKLVANRRPITALTGTTKREYGTFLPKFANATAATVADLCQSLIQPMGLRNDREAVSECQRHYVLPSGHQVEAGENSSFSFWAQQCELVISAAKFYSSCYKEASSLRRKGARVYLYSFDYEKAGQEDIGPYHAFDMTYLIGIHPFPFDVRDKQIQKIYAALFANFVKYGDPTPNATGVQKWTPLEFPLGFNYYSVDLPQPMLKPDYHKEDILFWNYELKFFDVAKNGRRMEHVQNYMQVMEPSHEESPTALAKWQVAFWIALTILVATVVATLALFVQLSYSSRRRHRQLRVESQSLIRTGDGQNNDYQTFRM